MSAEFPVAIVGIGCRLPGGSDTKELYYEFLRNKVSIHDYSARILIHPDSRAMGCLNLLLIGGMIKNGEVVRQVLLPRISSLADMQLCRPPK